MYSNPCADCGISGDWRIMQWDHVPGKSDGAKVGGASLTRAWKTIWADLERCDLVCANCHQIRTHERGQYGPVTEIGKPI